MKFYIASGFSNLGTVRSLAKRLIQKGWRQTYDWTQNKKTKEPKEMKQIAALERNGVKESDIVIVLLPGGKGCHTELGIAIGLQKTIYIFDLEDNWIQAEDATAFYHLKEVTRFSGNLDTFFHHLINTYPQNNLSEVK